MVLPPAVVHKTTQGLNNLTCSHLGLVVLGWRDIHKSCVVVSPQELHQSRSLSATSPTNCLYIHRVYQTL
jgi:hypothetical protein